MKLVWKHIAGIFSNKKNTLRLYSRVSSVIVSALLTLSCTDIDRNESRKYTTEQLYIDYKIHNSSNNTLIINAYLSSLPSEESTDESAILLANGDSLRIKTDTVNEALTRQTYGQGYSASITLDTYPETLRVSLHRPKLGEIIDTTIPIPKNFIIQAPTGAETFSKSDYQQGLLLPISWAPPEPDADMYIRSSGTVLQLLREVEDDGYYEFDSHGLASISDLGGDDPYMFFYLRRSYQGNVNSALAGGRYSIVIEQRTENVYMTP